MEPANSGSMNQSFGPYDSKYTEINNHVEDKNIFVIILVFNEYL